MTVYIIDIQALGQQFKYRGQKESDVAERNRKDRIFLGARFGQCIVDVMRSAKSRKNPIVKTVPTVGNTHGDVYSDDADEGDRTPELERTWRNFHAYLTSFTSSDANKVTRLSGDNEGLEPWQRLRIENDPTSGMR